MSAEKLVLSRLIMRGYTTEDIASDTREQFRCEALPNLLQGRGTFREVDGMGEVSLCKGYDHNYIDQNQWASNCEAERWLKN